MKTLNPVASTISVDIVSKIGTNPCNIDNGHNISGINIDASGNDISNIIGSNIVNNGNDNIDTTGMQ